MKFKEGKRLKMIGPTEAKEFEAEFNRSCIDLDDVGIEYEVKFMPQFGHCAYLLCSVDSRIAETLAERFEIAGHEHTCGECPFYEPPTDHRKKYTDCMEAKQLAYSNKRACDKFYEAVFGNEEEVNL